MINKLFKKVISDWWFTYNTKTKRDKKAWVSPFLSNSKIIKFNKFTENDLKKYIFENKRKLSEKNVMLGAWHDQNSWNVFLDLSIVENDKNKAIKITKKYNQIAIWDLKNNLEIACGWSGGM